MHLVLEAGKNLDLSAVPHLSKLKLKQDIYDSVGPGNSFGKEDEAHKLVN